MKIQQLNKILHVHSETQQCVLTLVATIFGHYGHHQTNAIEKFKNKYDRIKIYLSYFAITNRLVTLYATHFIFKSLRCM